MKVLGRLFQQRGWAFANYDGKMTHEARDNAITTYDRTVKIMIASLKCGDVGLDLTMASCVICVDQWWNSSVEQQAFCRVFQSN
jgi:SNF2 family DNA or RNA helicase